MKKSKNKKDEKLHFNLSEDLILIPTNIPLDSLYKLYTDIKDILLNRITQEDNNERNLFVINEVKNISDSVDNKKSSNTKDKIENKLLSISFFNLTKIIDISVAIQTPPYFIVKTLLLLGDDLQDLSVEKLQEKIKENKDKIFNINHYLLYVREFEYVALYRNSNILDIINIKI